MATIWARVGGAWNGSIWDWINPETEQVEAYPYASPRSGDYVYTNGKAVTYTASISVGRGTISNAANNDLGIVAGGYVRITITSHISITGNIIGGAPSTATIQRSNGQSSAHNISITGSITTVVANARCYQEVGSQTLVGGFAINGNVNLCAESVGIWCSYCTPTITGNVNCESNAIVFRVGTYVAAVSISGNVTLRDGAVFTNGYESGTITIPSTCTMTNGARYSNTTNTTTITRIALGNYSSDTNFTTQGVTLVEVNGNFVQRGNNTKFSTRGITTFSIYGTTTLYDTAFVSGTITYLTLNGNLTYEDNPTPLGNLISLTVGDEFEIHCISSGSNDIIMISRYQLDNTNQYPSPANVKKDIPYAWGELVGQYLPDYPPETVVLKDYVYDTITAEENDIATYNLTRYIYADYGTLHWFELKTTTTDIVTTPSQQSISIDGETVVADTDYVVEYNDACYQWDGSAWGSITTNNIGTVKTDIVTNPTETTLCAKKGTLDVPSTQAIVTAINQSTIATNVNTLLQRLSDGLTQRLGQSVTIPILQQILDAHLN